MAVLVLLAALATLAGAQGSENTNIRFVCSFVFERYNHTISNGSQETVGQSIRLSPVCCPGFKRNGSECVPHCEGGCGDGVCKFPGVCSCEKKFHYCNFGNHSKRRAGSCLENCRNGVCQPNNTCVCHKGYTPLNSWTAMFTDSSLLCVPICFPFCSNKHMSSPEDCECARQQEDSSSVRV